MNVATLVVVVIVFASAQVESISLNRYFGSVHSRHTAGAFKGKPFRPVQDVFCDETHFDSVFQVRDHIHLNLFDKGRNQNKRYVYSPGGKTVRQYIDEVTEDFPIPQSGFFVDKYDGTSVLTYYTAGSETSMQVCAHYGSNMRLEYSSANPYPFVPLCGCNRLTIDDEIDCHLYKNRSMGSNSLFSRFQYEPSYNNKYKTFYYDNEKQLLYSFKRETNRQMLYHGLPDLDSVDNPPDERGFYINFEVIGMFSIREGGKLHRYIVEEVVDREHQFVTNYVWKVKFAKNGNLEYHDRVLIQEFFGCTSTSLISVGNLLLIVLFSAFVSAVIVMSVVYFYLDYALLIAKVRLNNLSYYLS